MSAQLQPLSSTRGYIGGGSIAGILGLSPFKTPLDEYLTITGDEAEISDAQREFFDDRRDLEPWAAKKFTRRTGLAIVRTNERYDDAEFPWAKAEIDFEPEGDCNGETKTVHPNAVSTWGDPDAGDEGPRRHWSPALLRAGPDRLRRSPRLRDPPRRRTDRRDPQAGGAVLEVPR